MLVDIFSSFDPATHQIFNIMPTMFWMTMIMFMYFIMSNLWLASNSISMTMTMPSKFMFDQLTRSKTSMLKSMNPFILSLFLMIIMVNMMGLMPYIFSVSSHLYMTLALGAPMWLALILSSLINSPTEFAAGLLPSGAPSWLAPALVLIETISMLVRPITLSFRLAANMSAGHIVLGLVNMYLVGAIMGSISSFSTLLVISVAYTMFEVGICLVQAYIFCLLLSLYADDHSS